MYERVASNVRKSWLLILIFVALIAAIGYVIGLYTGYGYYPVVIAVLLSVALTWGSWYASDRIALSMSRAKPADEVEYRQLHNVVEEVSIGSGVPKPRVYVIDDDAPNAFATGRDPEHAAIAVTRGLIEKMNRAELQGVLAHELSHIKNRDTLVMTLTVTLVGMVVLLADWFLRALWWGAGRDRDRGNGAGLPIAIIGFVLILLAPLFAQLLQFAISRQREYLADADAVLVTRYPEGLISALEKLRSDKTVVRSGSRATAHLWIEQPIPRAAGEGGTRPGTWLNRMFDTHPPLESRIEALRSSSLTPTATTSSGAPQSTDRTL
jgi:heat shock protein HtpX